MRGWFVKGKKSARPRFAEPLQSRFLVRTYDRSLRCESLGQPFLAQHGYLPFVRRFLGLPNGSNDKLCWAADDGR